MLDLLMMHDLHKYYMETLNYPVYSQLGLIHCLIFNFFFLVDSVNIYL
jgi:hypothetical protein